MEPTVHRLLAYRTLAAIQRNSDPFLTSYLFDEVLIVGTDFFNCRTGDILKQANSAQTP